jgi:lactoylglutathione lyase
VDQFEVSVILNLSKDQLPVSLRSQDKVFTFSKLILRQAQDDRFLKEDLLKPQTDAQPRFDSMSRETESSAMITRLLHTRYRVNDLEKTTAFYRDVLGLEEVRRHTSPRGSTLVFFKAPKSDETIEICHFPASGPVIVQPDLTHIAFEVEDLDAFAQAAAAKGYPLSDGPTASSSGKFAFIDAPDGYEIELIEHKK